MDDIKLNPLLKCERLFTRENNKIEVSCAWNRLYNIGSWIVGSASMRHGVRRAEQRGLQKAGMS